LVAQLAVAPTGALRVARAGLLLTKSQGHAALAAPPPDLRA
jgi:hypothetical protein